MRSTSTSLPSLILYRLALRLLAHLVPQAQQSEWIAEWSAELWYVRDALPSCTPFSLTAHRSLLAFTCGALADAHSLRYLAPPAARPLARSVLACLATLLLLFISTASLAHMLPGVRRVLHLSSFRRDAGVVTIWPAALSEASLPAISLRTVRSWQRRPQHLFRDFAFFASRPRAVHLNAHQAPELIVAYSSSNLPDLLGTPIDHVFTDHSNPLAPKDPLPRLLLSQSAWVTYFGSRPEIFGQTIKVGLQSARIAGVLPDEANPTHAPIDVWLLLPPAMADRLPGTADVIVLGRPSASSVFADRQWSMSVPGPERSLDFTCVALSAHDPAPCRTFFFALLLALLCLPAANFPFAGEGSPTSVRLPIDVALQRVLFLAAKLTLLLPAVFFCSLDLGFCLPWASPNTSVYLQLIFGFASALAALHWTLRDGSRRCPVCLDKLRCPARVGQPSRNFLTWNGTELICAGGHGLLHVPELPTSWFSKPQWHPLDSSWSSLFLHRA